MVVAGCNNLCSGHYHFRSKYEKEAGTAKAAAKNYFIFPQLVEKER